MVNLATVYRDTGHHEDGLPLFEEAGRIFEETLGPAHPHTVGSLREHAKLLRTMGDEAGANRLEDRAAASGDADPGSR